MHTHCIPCTELSHCVSYHSYHIDNCWIFNELGTWTESSKAGQQDGCGLNAIGFLKGLKRSSGIETQSLKSWNKRG